MNNANTARKSGPLLILLALVIAGGAGFLAWRSRQAHVAGQAPLATQASADAEQAIKDYQELCAAKTTASQGRHEEALAHFETIIRTTRNTSYRWDAEIQAASALAAMKKFDEALARLERVIRESPDQQEAWMARLVKGDVLSRSGKHDEALALFRQLIEHPEGNLSLTEESIMGIVQVAYRREQFGFVRGTLQRFVYDYPGDEDSRRRSATEHLTRLAETMRDRQSAIIAKWAGQKIEKLDPGETTWKAAEGPYLVTRTVTLGADDTLRIEKGAVVRFAADAALRIQGRLLCAAVEDQPVQLLPLTDDPGGHYWLGLEISGPKASAELTHCRIVGGDPGLTLAGGQARLERCSLEQCGRAAIVAERDAHLALVGTRVSDGYRYGIECLAGSALEMADCWISGFPARGLLMFNTVGKSVIRRCRWESCAGDAVTLRGRSQVEMQECAVQSAGGHGLQALEGATLAVSRSRFSENAKSGINLQGRCVAVIEGNTIAGNRGGGLVAEAGCSGRLSGNRIEGNSPGGVILGLDCTPAISVNSIVSNQGVGLLLRGAAPEAIERNVIAGNAEAGLRNEGAGKVKAAGNWWGSPEQAEVAKAIQDQSDQSEWGEVEYEPWLREAPEQVARPTATSPTQT